jgi:hypothetical protein
MPSATLRCTKNELQPLVHDKKYKINGKVERVFILEEVARESK